MTSREPAPPVQVPTSRFLGTQRQDTAQGFLTTSPSTGHIMLWASGMSQWLADLYSHVVMLVNMFRSVQVYPLIYIQKYCECKLAAMGRGAHLSCLSHNVCFLWKKDKQFRNQKQQCEFSVIKFRCINPLILLNTTGCIYTTCFNIKNLCFFPHTVYLCV